MTRPPSPEPDLPDNALRIETVRSRAELEVHLDPWRRLVEMAAEPNPFFEPELLLPALGHLADEHVRVVLLWSRPRQHREGAPVLCGLIPVRDRGPGGRVTGRTSWSVWRHVHCFLGTPLVRRDLLEETVDAFLDWSLEEHRRKPLLFPRLAADGPVFRAVWHSIRERELPRWVQDQHHRALFRRAESAEAFVARAIANKVRKELDRKRRRLAEDAALTLHRLEPAEDSAPWVDAFLALEARGWKGRGETALRASPAHARFLHEAVAAAHARGTVLMLRLDLDAEPIAANSAFLSSGGGCYFKIAHDERHAKSSPGAMLELDFIRHLHEREDVDWLDSCADPGHPMIERFWDERRFVQDFWIGTRSLVSEVTLAALGLGYAARRAVKTRRNAR